MTRRVENWWLTAWGRVSQPTHGAPWGQEGLLSERPWGQRWRVVPSPESPGTRAWLRHPQSPAGVWPCDLLARGLAHWLCLESGSAVHNPPGGLGSDVITHNPLYCCSLALLPTILCCPGAWLCCPSFPSDSKSVSRGIPADLETTLPTVSGAPGLTTGVGARVSGAPLFPCGLMGPVIEGWVVLTFHVPTWRRSGTFSGLLTGPRQLHPGGPGEGWQAGAGLSVRLSLLTVEPNHCFQD